MPQWYQYFVCLTTCVLEASWNVKNKYCGTKNKYRDHNNKFTISNDKWMVPGWFPTKIVQILLNGCIRRSWGQKIGFKMQKSSCLKLNAQNFHIWYIASLEVLYQSCSKYGPEVKIDPAPGVTFLHWIIKGKLQTTSSLEPLMRISPNSTGMIPGRSPTKIAQMVLIGCISRSRVQKLGF